MQERRENVECRSRLNIGFALIGRRLARCYNNSARFCVFHTIEYLFIYDFNCDSVYLAQADLRIPKKYVWSDDDRKIYCSSYRNHSLKNREISIYCINLLTKSLQEIIKSDSTKNTIGDIKQNKMIYIRRKTSYAGDYYIKIYDLATHKETFSLNMNKLGFK